MPADLAHQARRATLFALHTTPDLAGRIVLKGGLPLRHVYGSLRPSEDLDLNSVEDFSNAVTEGKEHLLLRTIHALDAALDDAAPLFGLTGLRVQHKRLSDELPTLMAEVGYTADADARAPYPDAVELQLTLSEVVCETVEARFDGVPVLVPSLEDIVADKLKVLLQQPLRRAARPHDAWDLWHVLTRPALAPGHPAPDAATVGRYLTRKCSVWDPLCNPARASFDAADVRERAARGYARLAADPGGLPLPASFDEAWAAVLAFVARLELPETAPDAPAG